MPVTAIIGAQWGDEGKGKIVDCLAQKADVVVRFNGGANAGHTVFNSAGEFRLHLIPAGIFNPNALCVIGNGVVIDPETFKTELDELGKRGVSVGNLKISAKAHLLLPWHILQDKLEEKRRGSQGIGTTGRGIGPAFSDKTARSGIPAGWLLRLDEPLIQDRLLLIQKNKTDNLKFLGGTLEPEYFIHVLDWLSRQRAILERFVTDTEFLIWNALEHNQNVLLEGAQGTLLDVDFGTYPNVTSSVCTAAGAAQGSGIPINKINEIIGVAKAYVTRVGSAKQPFPTEMPPDLADPFRNRAGEYGATTGRPRRIGWLDALLLEYSCRVNGFTSLALTRLDTLTGLSPLKICWGYRFQDKTVSCGSLLSEGFNLDKLELAEPLYFELPGWDNFPEGATKFSDFPPEAQRYVRTIESLVGVKVRLISTGPERDQIIETS